MLITVGAKCWNGDRRTALRTERGPVLDTTHLVVVTPPQARFKLDSKVKALIGYGIPLSLLASGLAPIGRIHAMAQNATPEAVAEAMPAMSMAIGDAFKSKIIHAFDPLINLIITLSYPIAGVMIAGGCLFIMVGNRERGMQMLQNAALGFILVQLSPMLLDLLVGIGTSM